MISAQELYYCGLGGLIFATILLIITLVSLRPKPKRKDRHIGSDRRPKI